MAEVVIGAPRMAGAPGAAPVAEGISGLWQRVSAWRGRRRRYRRTLAELNALSDHVLNDIGVERAEIPALAARLARLPRR